MVKVGADVTSFKTGMGEVNTKVDEAGSGFSKLGPLALGVAGGILAVGAGLTAFGMHAIDTATAAGNAAFDMSEKFGLSGHQASAYLSVGSQLGLTNEQVSKSFQFLSKNVSAMAITLEAGGKISAATGQVYKDLGINVLDSSGHVKSANELMLESADAFKGMADGPEKAALAMKLFGKSGTDMLPMLNQGRAGIQSMMDAGQKMGDVMSNEQVAAAHKLTLEHKQLDTAMAGITLTMGTALMPIMTALMGFVVEKAIPGIQQFAAYFREHLLPAIQQVSSIIVSQFLPPLKQIWANLVTLWPVFKVIGEVILGVLVVAIIAAVVVALVLVKVWLTLYAALSTVAVWIYSEIPKVGAAFSALGSGVNAMWKSIQGDFNSMISFIQNLPGAIASAASGMWNGIWNAFRGMLNLIVHAWNGLHFTVGGGSFAGVSIPSMTLGVPSIPSFEFGGTVPGLGPQLVIAHGGETISRRGGGVTEIHNHYDFSNALITDGPLIDLLVNKIVNRQTIATGR
jgi:hypothetical protein